jgi:predicted esterase
MLALLLPLLLPADLPPKGVVVDRVETTANARQSYALYLPSNYAPARRWPVLYCLDPLARGRVPVERFSQAAERAGVIVVGSNNSRNGPSEPVREAIDAMLEDSHARFSIDDTKVFVAGFSGGARVALFWAQMTPLGGVVAVGAGFMGNEIPKDVHARIFAVAGRDDFNYGELYVLSRELASRGVDHRFEEFEGGHEWLTASAAGHALEYLLGRLPGLAAPESPETRKQIENDRQLLSGLFNTEGSGQRAALERLRKDAAAAEDSLARRSARRAMGAFYVTSIENGRQLLAQKRFADAAQSYERAVQARPEANWTWFDLAAARAASGNKRATIEALAKAIEHGFKDRPRIDREPLFDRWREDAKFKAVVDTVPAK